MTQTSGVSDQYQDGQKLGARGAFNTRYANKSWFGFVDKHLQLVDQTRLLDIGCGPGWFWGNCTCLPAGIALTLVDSSDYMVRTAADRLSHLNVVDAVVADATKLPFADESFDVVTAMHMMYHLDGPAMALAECARVLTPGGRCIVTTNAPENLPQVAALSKAAFGSAIDDVVQRRFGTGRAKALMGAVCANVQHYRFTDMFLVDDDAMLKEFLETMPPGNASDAAGLARLDVAIAGLMSAHGGVVPMPVVRDVIVGA